MCFVYRKGLSKKKSATLTFFYSRFFWKAFNFFVERLIFLMIKDNLCEVKARKEVNKL
jgi:hypothetical protein